MSAPPDLPPLETANAPASVTPTSPVSQNAAPITALAPSTAAEGTTTEVASSSPCHGETSPDSHPLLEVAASLLARLKPFLSESHIEVEARLCNLSPFRKRGYATDLSTPVTAMPASTALRHVPRILPDGHRRIEVGVSAADFARMKAFVAEKAEASLLQQSVTEDVNTKTGRYTYVIAEDGSESFAGCIEKKRLCNAELHVPGCPYDIRVSISREVPQAAMTAPAVKPKGYVRRKRRWTAKVESFEYAFTRVGADDQPCPNFEVEIEGVHANSKAGVTEAWLEDLLRRMLALAQLEGNIGLP
ncbi:hypothetical protein, conserved [Leishmania tarentolae]|uniref:mRNA 5'-phosphatase n=1 Tax=Leishmania tarentolae TaxID=5689 RepID=A0A640KNS2_LEITA|nr:hypothetical protein, conserved [Leishmania tarentolae]